MTQNMSEKEFKNLRKLFIKIDKDMDGRITSVEQKNKKFLRIKQEITY